MSNIYQTAIARLGDLSQQADLVRRGMPDFLAAFAARDDDAFRFNMALVRARRLNGDYSTSTDVRAQADLVDDLRALTGESVVPRGDQNGPEDLEPFDRFWVMYKRALPQHANDIVQISARIGAAQRSTMLARTSASLPQWGRALVGTAVSPDGVTAQATATTTPAGAGSANASAARQRMARRDRRGIVESPSVPEDVFESLENPGSTIEALLGFGAGADSNFGDGRIDPFDYDPALPSGPMDPSDDVDPDMVTKITELLRVLNMSIRGLVLLIQLILILVNGGQQMQRMFLRACGLMARTNPRDLVFRRLG